MEPLTSGLSFAQREAIEQRIPALRELRIHYLELCESCALATISGVGVEAAEQKRQAFLKDMSRRQRELLRSNGINISSLSQEYGCALCRDTGIILDGGIKKPCQCRIQQQQRKLDEKFNNFSRFSDFNSSLYTDDEQRTKAVSLKTLLENYVSCFPNNERPNLLLRGNVGLGKTFFLNCLTYALHEKGIRCEMIPAYTLFESFRKQHMGEMYVLPKLSQLPFLAIDDLGVEPMYKNINIEYFNELLDLRLIRSLHTAITTNLDAESIRERYGERIASRMYDKKQFHVIGLKGKSLRRQQR